MYDWVELTANYFEQGLTQTQVLDNVKLDSYYHHIPSKTTWYNGHINNTETGRGMRFNVNDKGILRIGVCPPKYILGNNVEEASIDSTLELFTNLSNLVGFDLGDATLRRLDITHTASTTYEPVVYFPHLSHQQGVHRWAFDTSLYYGFKYGDKKNSKKFYDKVAEVDQRRTYGGKQTIPLYLQGNNLTRFEVGLSTNKSICNVFGTSTAVLGQLFLEEYVEALHKHWITEYEVIPKNREHEPKYAVGMGKSSTQKHIIAMALARMGKLEVQNQIMYANKMGALTRQDKSRLIKDLNAFMDLAEKPQYLVEELDSKFLEFEPKWE